MTLDVASDAVADVSPADDAAAAARADVERLATAFDHDRTVEAFVALDENTDTVVGLTAVLEGFDPPTVRQRSTAVSARPPTSQNGRVTRRCCRPSRPMSTPSPTTGRTVGSAFSV